MHTGLKADDFRSKSMEELEASILENKRKLFHLRMQLQSNQLSNTNEIRQVRRDIARAETVRTEKRRAATPAQVGKAS